MNGMLGQLCSCLVRGKLNGESESTNSCKRTGLGSDCQFKIWIRFQDSKPGFVELSLIQSCVLFLARSGV